jgi:uncharacterized BrkB/YihY/UPF0761 family membrane protein
MKTVPYFVSVAVSTVFLVCWLWYFLPDVTIPQGLIGIVLALVLRRILYSGLMKYVEGRGSRRGQ